MTIFILILLISFFIATVSCLNLKQVLFSNNKALKRGLKSIVAPGLLGLSIINLDIPCINSFHVHIAHADSTGKYSTKLTAKRRYIPRILKAIPLFHEFSSEKVSEEDIKSYLKSETFSDLTRAMKLYGSNLKKGEYPDEISRTAESLVDTMISSCNGYSQTTSKDKLKLCVEGFDKYISFTNIGGKE